MRLRVATGISVAVLILSNCFMIQPLALNASADFGMPVMTEGDYWEYNTAFLSGTLNFDGTIRFEIRGREDITVGSTTVSVQKTNLTGEGTFHGYQQSIHMNGGWTRTGIGYYSESSFEFVKHVDNLDIDGSWQYYGMSSWFSGYSHNTSTYEFLSGTWDYPIEVGDSGESNYSVVSNSSGYMGYAGIGESYYSENNTYNMTVKYSCSKVEDVTVPAGTFIAYLVKRNYGYMTIESWYAPEVGEAVKNNVYDRNGTLFQTDELVSYQYKYSSGDNSRDIILIIILAAITTAIVLLILIIGLLRRKRPVPASVSGEEPAQRDFAEKGDEPIPAGRAESGIQAHSKQKKTEPTFRQLAVRHACISTMVIGLAFLAFGIAITGIIETKYEIIHYQTDYETYGPFVTGVNTYPVYGRFSEHPYFIPGLFLIALGTVFLIGGCRFLIRNELIIRETQYQQSRQSGVGSGKGERRNGYARSNSHKGISEGSSGRQLFLGSIGAIIIGAILLIGAAALWNAEMKKEYTETRTDIFDEEYTYIGYTTTHPLRDEGLILAAVGAVMMGLAAIGIAVSAIMRQRNRRVLRPVKSRIPLEPESDSEEVY